MPRGVIYFRAGIAKQLNLIMSNQKPKNARNLQALFHQKTFNTQTTKQAAGRYYSKYNQDYRNRYKKRHAQDEDRELDIDSEQPCYDKEFNVLSASIGFASLMYLLMHKNQAIPQADEGTIEVEISFADDLDEGQMAELKVGEGKQDKVLITRHKGNLYAVGAYCTHFGFPLSKGVLFDDKVLCPLHTAGFSVVTGAVEKGPARDGLPKYEVIQKDGKTFVKVPEDGIKQQSKPMDMTKRDPLDSRNFVIVGGGAAGLNCAETLRQSGYTGKVTMITGEKVLPYDRTMLSKVISGKKEPAYLRDEEFLKSADIDIVKDKVYSIRPDMKKVALVRGKPMSYDKLLIATGGEPIKPNIAGIDSKHVYLLRNHSDQESITKQAENAKNIVIIGSGFVGSEMAAALKTKFKGNVDIHMVSLEEFPLELHLGKEIGEMLLDQHAEKGVKLHMKNEVQEITKDYKGDVSGVQLKSGSHLEADMVIVATGIAPATKFLDRTDTGITLDEKGAIKCDPFLQSSVPDIFAAGDVCAFPYWQTGQSTRIEHWINAIDQGSFAAFNMLDKYVPYGNTPFFWTRHYNKSIQYIGHCTEYDEVYIQGKVSDHKYIAYYIKNDKICAVASQGMTEAALVMYEAFDQNQLPSVRDLKKGQETIDTLKRKLGVSPTGGCRRENCCQKKAKV